MVSLSQFLLKLPLIIVTVELLPLVTVTVKLPLMDVELPLIAWLSNYLWSPITVEAPLITWLLNYLWVSVTCELSWLVTSVLDYIWSHNCCPTSDHCYCWTTSEGTISVKLQYPDHIIVELTIIRPVELPQITWLMNYPWSQSLLNYPSSHDWWTTSDHSHCMLN